MGVLGVLVRPDGHRVLDDRLPGGVALRLRRAEHVREGDTALVFLHGWGGEREYSKYQADAFAADYTVVTVDQAGFGKSGTDRKT